MNANNSSETVSSINSLREQLAGLENKLREEIKGKIENLPQHLGVNTIEEALDLIKENRNIKVHNSPKSIVITGKRWGRGRKIPGDVRTTVIDLLKSEKYTALEVAKKTGVSPAAVNKLKKQAGLVAV